MRASSVAINVPDPDDPDMDLVYRTESNVIHYRLSSPQRFVVVVALQWAFWCGFFFVVSCFFEASPVTARATAAPSLLPFRADYLILLVGSKMNWNWKVTIFF